MGTFFFLVVFFSPPAADRCLKMAANVSRMETGKGKVEGLVGLELGVKELRRRMRESRRKSSRRTRRKREDMEKKVWRRKSMERSNVEEKRRKTEK